MVSFIVPAHNEEPLIGATVEALQQAGQTCGEPFEIIVVNDASTDRTGDIAAAAGARVISVDCRQIAATRNRGASQARGDYFIFVDADTLVGETVVQRALEEMHAGAVGGGAKVDFDGELPWFARLLLPFFVWWNSQIKLAAGCFIFCTREAFMAVHGFDEKMFAAEEWVMSRALRRQGRMVMLRESVLTSGRKLRTHTARQIFGTLLHGVFSGGRTLQSRKRLDIWYGQRLHDRV